MIRAERLESPENFHDLPAQERVRLAAAAMIVNQVRDLEEAHRARLANSPGYVDELPTGQVVELPTLGVQTMADLPTQKASAARNRTLYLDHILTSVSNTGTKVPQFSLPRRTFSHQHREGLFFEAVPVGDFGDEVVILSYGDPDEPHHTRAFLSPSYEQTLDLYNAEADRQ